MESSPLSILLLVALLGALIYSAWVGERLRSSTGAVSGLAVAALVFGLVVGWFVERFAPFPNSIEDTVHFEGLRLEASLRFFLVTVMTVLAVAIAKSDALGRSKAMTLTRHGRALVPLFLCSIALVAHAKVAGLLAIFLAHMGR